MSYASIVECKHSLICFADDPRRRPKQIVDVGCGLGGTSKYLAKKYGATCHGINVSPVQAQKAQALAAAEGLADKVNMNDAAYTCKGTLSHINGLREDYQIYKVSYL